MKDKNFSEQEIKRKVFSFIEERKLIQEGDRVIAGISGGADSVCLFLILEELRKKIGFEILAVHVNHGIRGEEAKADEELRKETEKIRQKAGFHCSGGAAGWRTSGI